MSATLTAEWTEQDSHNLTVALVALDGHRMALRGRDRRAAIRAMVAKGIEPGEIATRLRMSRDALRLFAQREGIELPKPEQPWWVAYIYPSDAWKGASR